MNMFSYTHLRKKMVEQQLAERGIVANHVLKAFERIPREKFVPEGLREESYQDRPLSIGYNQTISQPYIVALMSELIEPRDDANILEIGTGSGYQAAILAAAGCRVYSVERIAELAQNAKKTLRKLNLSVEVKIGDGTEGWPEHAPYDGIMVTAAAEEIPSPLYDQVGIGGKIIMPVGSASGQKLTVYEKLTAEQGKQSCVCTCIFVPLIGKYAIGN